MSKFETTILSIALSNDIFERLDKHAKEMGTTKKQYVVSLIEKDLNQKFDSKKSIDFPEPHIADHFRLLGYSPDNDDIIIEFGKSNPEAEMILVTSVKMHKELAFALSSSIKDTVGHKKAYLYVPRDERRKVPNDG